MRSRNDRAYLGWAAVALSCCLGCDTGTNAKQSRLDRSDQNIIRSNLGELSDAARTIPTLKKFMASSTNVTAKEQKELRGKQYSLAEPIDLKVDGSTATFKVNIHEGEKDTVVEWTAVKEGEDWKLLKTPVK